MDLEQYEFENLTQARSLFHILEMTSCVRDTKASSEYFQRCIHTGCPRRNVKYFGRVFLESNYTDITQNTYIQS